ncbi:hypothetical protein W04_1700 [Pseudoalteromonas sp. SW0106-04]|nr:hypothetical protein W04_1700 [Pseudoalteromonas sp. SW0106-04]
MAALMLSCKRVGHMPMGASSGFALSFFAMHCINPECVMMAA